MFKIDSEFKSLIPALAPDELAQLEANIKADGVRDPLVVWNGILLDGHNRYEICGRLGLAVKTVDAIGLQSRTDAIMWIIHNQLGRRNLPAYERAKLALRAEPVIAARAKEAQKAGGQSAEVGRQKSAEPLETRKEIARAANVSHDTIARVKVIEARATPQVKAQLSSGDTSINAVYKDIRKNEVREEKRIDHARKIEQANATPTPTETHPGPYDLILADPPWRYEAQEAQNRAIENQYPTATIDEIFGHKPSAKPDSILFLWATAPKLPEALRVMEAWGFTYRTSAVWNKERVGMGYWFRGQHELLLVGVRGAPGATPECERVSSVFSEARTRHSVKPECVYQWIDRAFPLHSKLEMYCRAPHKNWAAWGNEVPNE